MHGKEKRGGQTGILVTKGNAGHEKRQLAPLRGKGGDRSIKGKG